MGRGGGVRPGCDLSEGIERYLPVLSTLTAPAPRLSRGGACDLASESASLSASGTCGDCGERCCLGTQGPHGFQGKPSTDVLEVSWAMGALSLIVCLQVVLQEAVMRQKVESADLGAPASGGGGGVGGWGSLCPCRHNSEVSGFNSAFVLIGWSGILTPLLAGALDGVTVRNLGQSRWKEASGGPTQRRRQVLRGQCVRGTPALFLSLLLR